MPIYSNKEFLRITRHLPKYIERDIYEIPFIENQRIDISSLGNGLWLINMNNASSKDEFAYRKIVHSFSYDNVLRRAYNDPLKYLTKVSKYYAVSTFDFSMDDEMEFPQILNATYSNRWIGAFLQSYGIKVIPTVGWAGKTTYDICFAGLRDGTPLMISSLGVNNTESYEGFISGYYEMRTRLPSSKIICVGNNVKGLDSDICLVEYKDSFGNWDKYQDYWQPKLYNWDLTNPERGV